MKNLQTTVVQLTNQLHAMNKTQQSILKTQDSLQKENELLKNEHQSILQTQASLLNENELLKMSLVRSKSAAHPSKLILKKLKLTRTPVMKLTPSLSHLAPSSSETQC
jgi:hypothetical protein